MRSYYLINTGNPFSIQFEKNEKLLKMNSNGYTTLSMYLMPELYTFKWLKQ